MTLIYQLILAVVVFLIVTEIFTQKNFLTQLTAAMALIPFILRLFMIG